MDWFIGLIDESWGCQSKKRKRRNWFTDMSSFIAQTGLTPKWPQMTRAWPKINHVDPKSAFVLRGMIFLTSGPKLKTFGSTRTPDMQVMYLLVTLSEKICEFQLFPRLHNGQNYLNVKIGGTYMYSFKVNWFLSNSVGMMKHGDVNQRNEKGEICSLMWKTLLQKRIFRVSDPKMISNDPSMT